jgi:hypothetical protein
MGDRERHKHQMPHGFVALWKEYAKNVRSGHRTKAAWVLAVLNFEFLG